MSNYLSSLDYQDREGLSFTPKREREEGLEKKLELDRDAARAEYRLLQNERFLEKQIAGDLSKARKTCEQMDSEAGIPRNEYWRPEVEDAPKFDKVTGEKIVSTTEAVLTEYDLMTVSGLMYHV